MNPDCSNSLVILVSVILVSPVNLASSMRETPSPVQIYFNVNARFFSFISLILKPALFNYGSLPFGTDIGTVFSNNRFYF